MELVVGDVDQPGAKETSPANCQHDNNVKWGQIVVIPVDIFHADLIFLDFFSDIQYSKYGQTEKIRMIFLWECLYLPEKYEEEYEEVYYLTNQCGLVVFLLLLFIQHGLIVNLAVVQNTGVGVHHDV